MNPAQGSIFQTVPGPGPESGNLSNQQSPFIAVESSPFAIVENANGNRMVEPGKPAKIPDKRPKSESPFQLAEEPASVGFEAFASTQAPQSSPFAVVGAPQAAPQANPYSQQAQSYAQPPAPVQAQPQAQQQPAQAPAFGGWAAQPQPSQPFPQASMPAFALPPAQSVQQPADPPVQPQMQPQPPQYQAPQPQPAAPQPAPAAPPAPEPFSIRQIELRAIFGVDREMSHEEILQRSRALPAVKHVARVDAQHISALEGLRQVLGTLGFGTGSMRIYCGASPVEFIREGQVVLAVQTDGGFAPGVRETLMIVARELGK